MAEKFLALGIHAATPLVQNYDTIWEKGKDGIERITRRRTVRETRDGSYGYDDKRRSSVGSYGSGRGRLQRRRRDSSSDSASDSESSIPPRDRRRAGPAQSQRGRPQESDSYSYSGSTSSNTEDLKSSSEDEKEERKKRRDEILTGGIAAVASLHAAANIWGSMKAREARKKRVKDGSLTEKQAKVELRKSQFQDAAALGLAALSLKGAYGKWQGTVGQHKAVKEHKHARRQRHAKRLEKGMSRQSESRQGGGGGGGGSSGTVATTRPAYNRGYSRSENDLSRTNRYRPGKSSGGYRPSRRYGGGGGGGRDHDRNDYGAYDEEGDAGGEDGGGFDLDL